MVDFTPQDTTGNHRYTDHTYLGHQGPKRTLILWELPHLGGPQRYIEMYINPQSISSNQRKAISQKRTKGGFIIQYWGEELESISINGLTGDSGIEGINVLQDAYRSEQLALVAIANARIADSDVMKRRQPLAALAASVIMWYQGQGKRGYFTDFFYEESVQQNGMFNYRITFVVTQVIGTRANFMPWHRKPWSTTQTPNIGPGGTTVTGGYKGDTVTRVGRLNSPSGAVQPVVTKDSLNRPVASAEWVANDQFDPKYKIDEFAGNKSFTETNTSDFLAQKQNRQIAEYNEVNGPQQPPTQPTGKSGAATDDTSAESKATNVTLERFHRESN